MSPELTLLVVDACVGDGSPRTHGGSRHTYTWHHRFLQTLVSTIIIFGCSVPGQASSVKSTKDEEQEVFGPRLPPPSATAPPTQTGQFIKRKQRFRWTDSSYNIHLFCLTAGGATSSVCFPTQEETVRKRSKEKKHKNKKQHKHKKEKKVEKILSASTSCLILLCWCRTSFDSTEKETEEAQTQWERTEEEEQKGGIGQQWGGGQWWQSCVHAGASCEVRGHFINISLHVLDVCLLFSVCSDFNVWHCQ